jgi:hypothetical protein
VEREKINSIPMDGETGQVEPLQLDFSPYSLFVGPIRSPEQQFVDSIIKEAIRKRDVKNIDLLALRDVQFRWRSFSFNRKTIVFNVTAITLGLIVGLGRYFHQELLETFYPIEWFLELRYSH